MQIETVKLDFKEKAQSKVGSKDNIKHKPGGGDKPVRITRLCRVRKGAGSQSVASVW